MEAPVIEPPNDLRAWIGRSETAHDTLHPTPVLALGATLDHPGEAADVGTVLPPLWHWLYFLPLHRQSQIGPDGHALRGGFLPPVPLPRRMWAGSQLEFHAPLRVGERVARTSTLQDVTVKDGRNGPLVFVKVRHELRCKDAPQPALVEWHDIVYRQAQRADEVPTPPLAAPQGAAWTRELVPDEVLLFRYSALTFNAHRIHYDRRYVSEVEAYPGLVVHGPLIATLLLDLLRRERHTAEVAAFRFKALRPSFDGHPMGVHGLPSADGKSVRLWATDHEGWLTMDASAMLR
jgi:3-methylfumaryl-CoA hydratase